MTGQQNDKDWPLEPFDTTADAHTLKHSWNEWLETFEMVLETKKVYEQRERFLLLMTRGGKDLRLIHKNQSASEEEVVELKPPRVVIPEYDNAVLRLNKYFGSKINTRMELERFRTMKQGKSEDFTKFVLKLRAQANRCGFGQRTEEEIMHQATSGAADEKVRDKRINVEMTLDQLTQYAVGREILQEQRSETAGGELGKDQIQAVSQSRPKKRKQEDRSMAQGKKRGRDRRDECGNCGSWRHKTGDKDCRAKTMKCFNCNLTGHLAAKCSKKQKQQNIRQVATDEEWEDETPKGRVEVKAE